MNLISRNLYFFLTYSSLIDYYIEEFMDNQMFWTQYTNQPGGKILYQTEALLQDTTIPLKVSICEKLIIFNKMCLQYSFDLKITIKPAQVKFQYQQNFMTFSLPRNDQKQWREILRGHLNQRGFHEAFKPIKKIGKGNFASVFLVQKIQTKAKLAVKAFSKQSAYSEQNGKQCLIKQIQIMRNLNHRSLMKLEEVFESDNSLYIIFQLLDGGQLFDKFSSHYKFRPNEIQSMMKDLLQGLKQMHSKGIMHRDLKPQNILIRSKDRLECVIADFGLSQFANLDQYLFVRCGTPGYVAPQVINIKDMKKTYSPICDIFSLGLIFHLFLFGFSIFRKKTYKQILDENRACKFTFEDQIYQSITKQTLDLLKKMLRVNPQERITAEQALAHPYFRLTQVEFQELMPIKEKSSFVEIQSDDSPNLLKEKFNPDSIQDSCVKLKVGKQNVMVGNTNTINDVGESKISFARPSAVKTPGRVSTTAKSKFNRMVV